MYRRRITNVVGIRVKSRTMERAFFLDSLFSSSPLTVERMMCALLPRVWHPPQA